MRDPQLYSGRDLRRRMLHLPRDSRRRVDRAVRRGERAQSPEEAQLVLSVARANVKIVPLMIGLLLVLVALRIVAIAYRGMEWFDVALFILVAVALAKFALWDLPRFRRAERLNREVLDRST